MTNIITYFINGLKAIITFIPLFIKYLIIGLITSITILPKYFIIGLKYITEKKDSKNPNKNILKNNFVSIIIVTLSLTTYLLSVFILTRWYVQNERTKNFTDTLYKDILLVHEDKITKDTPNQYEDLTKNIPQSNENNNNSYSKPNTNYLNVNLNPYIQKNSETVAWLQVNNTNVNYPVVQHEDNSFYLEHDFYQRTTNVGWVFADYRNDLEHFNNNTIFYAHNLINRTMFGQIPYLLRRNWFNNPNSHYIKLSTKNTNSVWQIFSVYKIEPTTDYLQARFNSVTNYQEFLNTIKNRSEQTFDLDITYTDKIITLSTCDDIGTKRVVIHAKLIKIENK